MQTSINMSFDEWEVKYHPTVNHLAEYASFDNGNGGLMFETYGEEVEYVLNLCRKGEENRVWTYVDGDDGTYLVNGLHYVNRIGYFVTEKPCLDVFVEVVVSTDNNW